MSSFNDENIEQGVRKRTEYENTRRARLVLNVDRKDGGKLQLPILLDARTTDEEENIQQNTLLAVVPMARLPGYDSHSEAPRGALPRPGRIYVFLQNRLWRELECDGRGQLFEVDVAHWRKKAKQGGNADQRDPVGKTQHLIILPVILQGRDVANDLYMAYSEMPWTWEYIQWLEASSGRIKNRCQNIRPAWAAAVVDAKQWKPTQTMPALPIANITQGLCARELHLETLLDDPALFTPAMQRLPEKLMIRQLENRQQELATLLQQNPPEPVPASLATADLLAEYQLRDYPKLVGLILDDPLFDLRHAVVQSQLAVELLQALNALVPHQPFGRYAEVLYQEVMPIDNLSAYVDRAALNRTMLHTERQQTRECLYRQQERILRLIDKKLPSVWNDWLHSHDERLLEPYALLVELLELLQRSPKACDARCIEAEDRKHSAKINAVAKKLIGASHALTRDLLSSAPDKLPETLQRLKQLKTSQDNINPERLGISSLALLISQQSEEGQAGDQPPNYSYGVQNIALAIDELLTHVAKGAVQIIKRLSAHQELAIVEMQRAFAPSFRSLQGLHSRGMSLNMAEQGEAIAQGKAVVGVHGAGLSFGITPGERAAVTRKNYLYASLEDSGGRVRATSSGKLAERLNFASKDLGRLQVVVVDANDPLVQDFNKWRFGINHLDTAERLSKSTKLPLLASVLAVYNLHVNSVGSIDLIKDERTRWAFGLASAVADLGLAANNVALKLLEKNQRLRAPWYVWWESGRFDVSRVNNKLGQRWATNLAQRTGSTWLTWSRLGSTGAMGLTAFVFAWDAYRASRDGEQDVAVSNAIAASGAGVWALYTLGLLASPWLLGVGVVALVAGSIAAAVLSDSALEQAVKHGPFGREQRLPQMNDPVLAYQQLLGALGAPRLQIERLQDWLNGAKAEDKARLDDTLKKKNIAASPYDWVVILHSPLLGQFNAEHGFTLTATERVRTRGHFSSWSYQRKEIARAKLNALILDNSRALYLVQAQFPIVPQYDVSRARLATEYGLKVCGQFHLGELRCRADDPFPAYASMIIPQPKPRAWQPYNPAVRPVPRDEDGDELYWLISERGYAKI
ncbi:hypothetical protein ACPESN_09990 [Stutzerimonas marianensis]|uniref:hypothetical protein n=1 Tax=Stutzerimonas marianensis TaxID=2929513 RepID=UPI003C2D0BB8